MTVTDAVLDRQEQRRSADAGLPAGGPSSGANANVPLAPGYLFHPLVDFLCLGGGSLLVWAGITLFMSPTADIVTMGVTAAMIAHVVNNPHFAYSYQIFYRGFGGKAFGNDYPLHLRRRYLFAGIVVPLALAGFFASTVAMRDPKLLAFGANIMGFFVGWHYVKQGYGMLIVDSVLKRQFFSDGEKKLLWVNAYACWSLSWLLFNFLLSTRELQGFSYAMIRPPITLVLVGIVVVAVSTALVIYMLAKHRLAEGKKLPLNGTVAYFVSLYVWLCPLVSPLFLLVIPALHSLQYLVVVCRFRWNADCDHHRADGSAASKAALPRFVGFIAAGVALGWLGFWGVPAILDAVVPYDHKLFNGTMFLFMFWIFINVHHYFLDNVMWRRENPDVGRYLFAHR